MGGIAVMGGTAGDVGSAGSAGQNSQPQALAGDYDVHFSALPRPASCEVRLSSSRMNLQIDTLDGIRARAFRDYGYDFVEAATPALDDRLFELPSGSIGSTDAYRVPNLHLNLVAGGFAGDGWADMEFDCQGRVAMATTEVKVVPDQTSPTLRVLTTLPTGKDLFPFSAIEVALSEPVTTPLGAYDDDLEPSDAASSIAMADTESGDDLPMEWYTGLASPVANARFSSLEGLAGRTVEPRLLVPLRDRAGNPALPDDSVYFIREPATLGSLLSFDEAPLPGVVGAATWFPPDSASSPCESGGCIGLDGAGYGCSADFTDSLAYLAVSFGESPPAGVRIRYRILYVDETDATVHLFQHYPSACVGYKPDTGRHALPMPVNGFAYGTDWITTDVSFCMGPAVERGMLFALGCPSLAPAPPRVRLVIEWLEPVR